MKNSEESSGLYNLNKKNIIRGFRVFSDILKDSKVIQTGYIKAYIRTQKRESLKINLISPLVTDNVKVGFIIAKKFIKKSFFRNRIRRLLKESYRKNKLKLDSTTKEIFVIYSLTAKGYNYFKEFPFTKCSFIDIEMKKLNPVIVAYLEKN